MDIRKYTQDRDGLSMAYKRLGEIAGELGNRGLQARIDRSREELLSEGFKIVVVGEFSRGKSTFINAMLGSRLLPAKINPTTTTINRICYGDEPRYILHYRQTQEKKEITAEEFKRIVAVESLGDEEEALAEYQEAVSEIGEIAYTELRYPLVLCQGGIEIIDTPGTNDLDQAREEITLRFIPQADAAIMLLSPQQILARSELDFIQERILKNDIQKVFFVVNFKDRLHAPEDGERICSLAREQLRAIVDNPKVHLVSAKEALQFRRAENGEVVKGIVPAGLEETGFVEMEAALSGYLLEERAAVKLAKYRQRLVRLSEELLRESIAVRKKNIGVDAAMLAQQLAVMRPRIERARERSRNVFARVQVMLPTAADALAASYRRGLEGIARQAVMSVHSYTGELTAEALAHSLEELTAPMQQAHDAAMEAETAQKLAEVMQFTQSKIKAIWQTEDIAVHKELVPVEGSGHVPMEVRLDGIDCSNSDIMGGGMILGGIVLAVHAPLIVIPAALFGGQFFLRQFERYRRVDFLSKASAQIRTRYMDITAQQAAEFRARILRDFHSLAATVEEIIDHQITIGIGQLEQLLAEKRRAAVDDERERNWLLELEQEIHRLSGREA